MKKTLAFLAALVMVLSLCACGSGKGSETTAAGTESKLTAEQQIVVDAVHAQLESDQFAQWQKLAKEFSGNNPKAPEVTSVVRYEIKDFDGSPMDCYLVSISADVAYWVNEAAQQGAMLDQFQLFISSDGKTVTDSITTDACNGTEDTTTDEGRAIYLLWIFGNRMSGDYEGSFLNDSETVTEWTADEIAVVNGNI
ncbi:MAG: hypothetical protein SPI15_10015 [Candidatus Faecousia sp.]|nr:hypothetical protein [Clostridiales bacterium]MDY6181170.1 hypothetical protein [Candidatus Faecousia sp.]